MNPFLKGVLYYTLQVVVALVVGTLVGSLIGIGLTRLINGSIDRGQVFGIINGSLGATIGCIIWGTATGSIPVPLKEKKSLS